MIKKILVPTDFSERANSALAVAADIAKQHDAALYLLNVIEVPHESHRSVGMGLMQVTVDSDEAKVPYMQALIKATKASFAEICEPYADLEIHQLVVFDRVRDHIHAFVNKNDVDLIVMGSHGLGKKSGTFAGTNAQDVVRYAKCPTLIIKNDDKQDFMPRNITFTFASEELSEVSIDFCKKLQLAYGSTLNLVEVITLNNFEPSSKVESRLEDFAKKHELDDYTINSYAHYTKEEGILQYVADHPTDLIVMTTHGKTGVSLMLSGSVTEAVTNYAHIPVLSFNTHGK